MGPEDGTPLYGLFKGVVEGGACEGLYAAQFTGGCSVEELEVPVGGGGVLLVGCCYMAYAVWVCAHMYTHPTTLLAIHTHNSCIHTHTNTKSPPHLNPHTHHTTPVYTSQHHHQDQHEWLYQTQNHKYTQQTSNICEQYVENKGEAIIS